MAGGVSKMTGSKPAAGGTISRNREYLPYESVGERTLWSLPAPKKYKFIGGGQSDPALFDSVMKIREKTDSRWPDQSTPADAYSDHYCLWVNDAPVGCLSMTRALHGPIFLQEYFPKVLFEHYHDRIMSAYRFRLLPKFRRTSQRSTGVSLAGVMAKEAWREQIAKGVGLDVIDVEATYVKYYQRLGYVHCEGHDFICPIFHEPIAVLYLPTDPTRESLVKDLVQDRDDHVMHKDVERVLRRKIFPLRSVG